METISREEAKKWILETCGEGWLNLIDIVYDNKPEHIVINEVFQKWGALTFALQEKMKYLKNGFGL